MIFRIDILVYITHQVFHKVIQAPHYMLSYMRSHFGAAEFLEPRKFDQSVFQFQLGSFAVLICLLSNMRVYYICNAMMDISFLCATFCLRII